jgi:RNA polymerase sigma-70 factor (ECF subfamily)
LPVRAAEVDMQRNHTGVGGCILPAELQTAADARVLVLRIIEHDELAFERVYEQFQKHVFVMALGLLQSEFEAEEVLQDVFMALWRRPPTLPHGLPSLIAWFTVTTRNQCWMRLRRAQHETFPRETFQDPEYLEPVIERMAETELRCTLEREFLRAPQKHREVLTLTYYGDMGATEIANHLSLPVITVRKRLEVAISTLRRHLSPHDRPRRSAGWQEPSLPQVTGTAPASRNCVPNAGRSSR